MDWVEKALSAIVVKCEQRNVAFDLLPVRDQRTDFLEVQFSVRCMETLIREHREHI
jgi:hypothetical protein